MLELGFDETFLRMWHFYLEYCRAGFASGYLDVHQLTFEACRVSFLLLAAARAWRRVALLMSATALVARAVNRAAVVDVAWGLGFVLVALLSPCSGG